MRLHNLTLPVLTAPAMAYLKRLLQSLNQNNKAIERTVNRNNEESAEKIRSWMGL